MIGHMHAAIKLILGSFSSFPLLSKVSYELLSAVGVSVWAEGVFAIMGSL